MTYKLTVASLCIILFGLLLNTQPNFSVREFSFGSTTERLIHVVRSYTPLAPKADLASFSHRFDSLIFVGDVFLGRNVEYLIQANGYDYPYKGLHFNGLAFNAAVVGNFESAIPEEHIPTPENMLRFSVDKAYLSALHDAGFTHLSLANNHSMDFGKPGYQNTFDVLQASVMTPFGAASLITDDSITYLDVADVRVALIGLEDLSGGVSDEQMVVLVEQASLKSDQQIVFIHWGVEYDTYSSMRQQKLASMFVAAGADVVIGHHPHVVQEVDTINGVPVFYSLGNYIFDQYFSTEVKQGLLLSIDPRAGTIDLLPVTSGVVLSQPSQMSPSDHKRFLLDLAKRSSPELSEDLAQGQLKLKNSVASSSKMAMIYRIN